MADNPAMRTVSPHVRQRARRLAPFAAAALLPYALLALPPAQYRIPQMLASLALTLALGALAVFVPWVRLAPWTHVLPPLGYLVALGILRNAYTGTVSGIGVLALLPVFWLALHGTRAQLAVVLMASLAFFVAPVIFIGGAKYPIVGLRLGILFIAVAGIVGITVQRLVRRIREQAREREQLMAHLAELANTDALTGLPNRRAWTAALEDALAISEQTGAALTVAILDLDNFKAINDAHGHEYGDRVLASSAAAWRASLRPEDVVARLGGDEFAILLPGCRASDTSHVLEEMLAHGEGEASWSIGFAEWDHADSASELLHEADRALYVAKHRRLAAPVA